MWGYRTAAKQNDPSSTTLYSKTAEKKWEENFVSTLSLLILRSQLKPSAVSRVKECNFQPEGYGVVPGQLLSFLTLFLNIHFVFLVLLPFYLLFFISMWVSICHQIYLLYTMWEQLANLFTFTVYKTHIYIDLISVCSNTLVLFCLCRE